ncbi:GSCOCG00004747001-RA-CDS [Cotesia congregata]|uniref:Mitochondrial GTPase 1 n=1 Tax=Cotesia congregata TaxID=51543 RepID=A0A8J2HD46_COTCN|nr:GSCOCG00004747001-RA-CDS [Cotesia congregata]CAG5092084.1 Similar to AAEL003813: Mitochondrial GTPase 1 (Aedes aegypti) [Cotesia congregata]
MASLGGKVVPNLRDKFRIVSKDSVHWFPGHMRKGLRQMQQNLKNVDCIIEVHDARVPISGRCRDFRTTVSGLKPHILVLNKKDLADLTRAEEYRKNLASEGFEHVIFTNFKDQKCQGMQSILPLAIKLIENSPRYNRAVSPDFSAMIIGVPNVGKSSLINRLRNKYLNKKNATAVGAVPGITRSVLTRIKISEKPPVFVLDTPGILTPYVRDVLSGLKLSLVGCLQDHLVGQEIIADFLLFWLNKQKKFEYVNQLKLSQPNDNILEVLTEIAMNLNRTKRIRNFDGQRIIRPDYIFAAEHFIKTFRNGELGPVCLDDDIV